MPRRGRSTVAKEIRTTRNTLRSLDRSLRRLAVVMSQADGEVARTRSNRKLSVKARASLKLQGRYMGYMRQLGPRQKAQVRKIKETRGVRAAIAKAKSLAA